MNGMRFHPRGYGNHLGQAVRQTCSRCMAAFSLHPLCSTAWPLIFALRGRRYRRTLVKLRDLSPRLLRDLEFDRGDLNAIAHREVYGR